ncbi:hypothetical protein BO78DRAFT_167109 [Aspergillus sclerotiicarbonarius CBS 121057]|uniref:Uncharacterized protein n=1 Tax=Aspergillus sclerotiicarbonarius (strain CBS 121057 / IBT 28362) TaxID=1448318 RepID=A0A319ELR0_ASPSB|nr:hypothetical protein BO78DRAFT_167109 [Aspergillus sclerotiicarbonarius CBS 121057]
MASNRPEILILCIAYKDFLDDNYAPLLNRLGESAHLKRAKTADAAIRCLERNPKAVIVADEGVTIPANRIVADKLESYIRQGGLAIFGLFFPGFTPMDRFNNLFRQRFGLPWVAGDYHRSRFEFNSKCTLPAGVVSSSFPRPYSMKVLHIKNARPNEKIFIPIEGARTESFVFSAEPVDQTQAAVVGAQVGYGYVGYSGDVNQESESDQVILSLCGC